MRVLQLGPVPPPHGGVQANMSAIAERLEHFGHRSLLLAITKSDQKINSPNVYYPASVPQLLRLLLNLRADIVHLHVGGDFTLRLAILAFICGVLPGRKSILTFHSGGFAQSETGKAARRFSVRGFAVRRLDKVIVVNREMSEVFERYAVEASKIALVAPHILRQPDETVEIPENLKDFCEKHQPLLLSVGGLEPVYDVPLQMRVLELIKKDFPRAGLLVAGSGYQQAELENSISSTDCADSILLAGDVRHEAVLHLIQHADVLLRTTLFDGDAISVREALFLNTPVVASDNQMRPENVHLFKIGDLMDLHRATLEALEQGKSTVVNYEDGWKNIDRVLQIYRELLQTKPRRQTEPPQILANPKSKV